MSDHVVRMALGLKRIEVGESMLCIKSQHPRAMEDGGGCQLCSGGDRRVPSEQNETSHRGTMGAVCQSAVKFILGELGHSGDTNASRHIVRMSVAGRCREEAIVAPKFLS